jgi:hypothetical protein
MEIPSLEKTQIKNSLIKSYERQDASSHFCAQKTCVYLGSGECSDLLINIARGKYVALQVIISSKSGFEQRSKRRATQLLYGQAAALSA